MSIDIVVATTLSGGIGKDNELLIKNKLDLQRFREKTMGNFCLLARKTWESLPKPLKGRTNVVISRNEDYYIDPHLKNEYDIILHNDLNKIINHYTTGIQIKNLVCCGGADLYRQMISHTDRVFLTLFHETKEADSFFPLEYLDEHFEVVHKEEHEVDGLRFDFIDYKRKESTNE